MAAPQWTDNVDIIAPTTVARGSTSRGTIDLREKFGAYIFCKIGRGGTAGLTNGLDVLIRRIINNDTATAGGVHPVCIAVQSSTVGATSTTVNSDSNSGQAVLNVASSTGFTAGEIICVQDSGGGVTRLEWHRISKVAAGAITLDRNLQFTHTSAQADTVRDNADVFAPIWVDGGALYEVIFDYGDDSTGDTATIAAQAQTYNA